MIHISAVYDLHDVKLATYTANGTFLSMHIRLIFDERNMFNLPFQLLLCIDTSLLTIESGNESANNVNLYANLHTNVFTYMHVQKYPYNHVLQ